MARRRSGLLLPLLLGFAAFAFAPSVLAGDPCYHGYTIPPASTAASTTVAMEPCAFSPTITRVATGTRVTFENKSAFTHLVTGVGATWGDRDKELAPGMTVSYAFSAPGIYPYSCALHRGMSGVIVVGDGPAADLAAGAAAGAVTGSAAPGAPVTVPVAGAVAGIIGVGLGLALAGLLRRRRAGLA